MSTRVYRKWVNRILLVLTFLVVLTGLGITYPGIVETLTLGFLGKSLSYKIHTFLWGPFLIAVLIHIYLSLGPIGGKSAGK
jgi:thiosulfate reductase cytochrome b subunit